ncbi:OVARIAN TUMOR DOMAIN-containing deubiquitinating enzyme 9 isoform X1 [Syzygium oleosum]|uniref:OVARIAN TUMOR DOMAIN-containing deubiquitinating enzyme 9 isoform X1 n=1 Tax=Syzygium oleosum TaxID=219896 RepID=UPI0011D1915D|nr:OVARIAN TUMOR DOMAIN-containing deubiquitinating enzyme 9 isoform X1 [Syzygium oleosum]
MTMHDQDPNLVRWGLHQLLDVCSISNAGSCGCVTQYDPDLSSVEHVREGYVEADQPGYVEAEQPSVENDEMIAHALQEELSRLALEEASGASTSGIEQLQASVLTQDWLAPSERYSDAEGWENDQRLEDRKEDGARDEVGNANSCSSSGSDYDVDMLHMADESVLDGEVSKRLNQMVPVRHVPKINGEIPSVEEEVSDHQRLLDRLQIYDLVENKIQGDGNCQFRALSDQLYRSPEHHRFVRQQIVQQLKSCPEMYDGYVPMAFGDYLQRMSKSGEWGDHVTLQAAADSYGVRILVITSFKDTCYIEILPHISKSKRVIFLSFWAEVHYNSIYPEGELPELSDHKKKKWWWVF